MAPDKAAYLVYQQAKAELSSTSNNPRVAWQFGRACFDWAEFATNDIQRALLAREGMAACEFSVQADPDSAEAHYYLGMNQGQLARTLSLGALKLVNEMEAHFETAQRLDAQLDYAGPDRNLGLLYLQAPGWPVSVGNRSKARVHLHKAVERMPLHPGNRLNLMEAYDKWNEPLLLRREMKEWAKIRESARIEFPEPKWHWEWIHWEQRLSALQAHLDRESPDLRSPRSRG